MSSAPQSKIVRMPQPIAIAVEHVTQHYGAAGGAGAVLALDDVSLEIRRGEFLCLIGPSGCGKSTLLSIIGGLMAPSSGSVAVGGRKVSAPRPREIAFVFQESTLLPWYTVLENFRLALEFQGARDPDWRERAMTALRAVGMEAFAQHRPGQLSVGMRQRVNLARSLCVESEILLMDEPFAALDEQTRMVLGEDLSALLARTRRTIVFVTHSLAEAVFLADRVAVMTARPGRIKAIVEVGEPHPRSPDFMLTPAFSTLRNELFALLRDEIRESVAAMRDGGGAR